MVLALLGVALPLTLTPSTPSRIVLWTLIGLGLVVLVVTAPPVTERFWKAVARRVTPHLPYDDAHAPRDIEKRAEEAERLRQERLERVTFCQAAHKVLDELGTIRARSEAAYRDRHYRHDFDLPANEWREQQDDITVLATAETRVALSRAYVLADHLNRNVRARGPDESDILDSDGLAQFLAVVGTAERALRQEINRVAD